ncbi:hypothetical protein [Cesiribacter andamanensis]|uniref:Uncharacterized protein n=1 Tax=Cesiribacter andamanensis AMV16 TaxID=1279009 RepID=M7NRK2_9BACT|nr:hypothetical protein [Cesiribacter andamanensis]EMR04310.1 hypothetical protein ADICEAN_00596 [Cesiribacter andamanensis AMV16]
MTRIAPLLLLATLLVPLYPLQAQQTAPPAADKQIALALLAAPSDKREGAAVWGYSPMGELVLLRKGTNELVCLADDPRQEGFSVSCYHKDLDPFMARGRELRKGGMSFQEIFDTREKESKSGKLILPKQPTTLFVYTAPRESVNVSTGEVKNGYLRYVVYIPWATAESTGLPLKPEGPAMPWIMYPGTHAAHIMINPPQE